MTEKWITLVDSAITGTRKVLELLIEMGEKEAQRIRELEERIQELEDTTIPQLRHEFEEHEAKTATPAG